MKKTASLLVCTFAIFIAASSAFAQDFWIDGTGNWFTAGNWSGGVPTNATNAQINNGGTAQIGSGSALAGNLGLGLTGGPSGSTAAGNVRVANSATLAITNNFVIGNSSSSTLSSAGFQDSAVVTTGGNAIIGNNAGSMGEVRLQNMASWTITGNLAVGNSGDGTLRIFNVDFNAPAFVQANNITIGNNLGSTGRVELTGPNNPPKLIANGQLIVGNSGDGEMRILNGGFAGVLGNIAIGNNASGTGRVVVDGFAGGLPSELETVGGNIAVGNDGRGTLDVTNGGVVGAAGDIAIARNSGSMGRVTVDGVGSTVFGANVYVGGGPGAPGGDGMLTIINHGTVNATNLTVWGQGSDGRAVLRVDSTYTINSAITFDGGILRFRNDTDFINDATLNTNTGPVGVVVDTNDTVSTISGTFSGAGGLTKQDVGTLILTADNPYTGDTDVRAGTLVIDGSVGGDAIVRNGATLEGTYDGSFSNVGHNLLNHGTLSPGNSPATFEVGNNFRNFSDGTYIADVGGLAEGVDSDLVHVLNQTDIQGGTIQVNRFNNFMPSPGDRVTVIRSDNGRSGSFDTLVPVGWGLIHPVDVYDDPFTVDIVFELAPFTSVPGLTPNQHAVAQALDRAFLDNCEPALVTFVGNITPLDALPHAYDLIAPEELTSMYEISFAQAIAHNNNLIRRMEDIRAGSNGYCAVVEVPTAQNYNPPIQDKNVAIPDKNVAPPTVVAPADCRFGFFANGTGDFAQVDDDYNAKGYEIHTGSFIAGADYRIGNHFAIGVNGGYASGDAGLVDGGRVDMDGGRIGGYATVYGNGFFGAKVHLDGAVGGAWNHYDTRRNGLSANFPQLDAAEGNTDGSELNALVAAGSDWTFGCFNVGTWSTFQYTNVSLDGFTEEGSLAPLAFPDQDQESIRATSGIRLSYDAKYGRAILRPEIRAAWLHEYGDQSYAIDARFLDCPGLFTVHGPKMGRDAALLGGGLSVQWSRCFATYVYYDGVIGRSNYDNNAVSGGVRFGF